MPKFRRIYYSSEEYRPLREEMEQQFSDWNLSMRLRLEMLFRSCWVLGISILIQTGLIIGALYKEMSWLFMCFTFYNTL